MSAQNWRELASDALDTLRALLNGNSREWAQGKYEALHETAERLAAQDEQAATVKSAGGLSEEELTDALSGLHAYDTGCVDSGIHDELLRDRIRAQLRAMADSARADLLQRICHNLYLTDEARKQGYGEEDAAEFQRWLRIDMALA